MLIEMKIAKDHPALSGHFPDNPIVPGVVILDQITRLWQEKSQQSIKQIHHTKFIDLLRPEVLCKIHYTEKDKQKITFIMTSSDKDKGVQNIICKGLFSYGE